MAKLNLFFITALVTTCLFGALGSPLYAQEVTRMVAPHAITLEGGFESAFMTRVGYSYKSDWLGDDSRIYARFALPVASPDLSDFAFDAGARMHLVAADGWGVQALAGPVLQHTENDLFAATALGVRAALLPGYSSERFGLMLDIGIEQMLTTQLQHSDLYEDLYYEDAKSGWYAMTAGTLHAGLRGGARIGRLELSAAAGAMSDLELQPATPPFYFTLGTAYSLE